jgi:uncharacterized protein (TIGR02231 family)
VDIWYAEKEGSEMELELTTTIAEVTVYPERALVLRRGTVALPDEGTHTLRIGGLPQTVQRDSLRATGRGPAGLRILGIEQAAEYHPAAPEETLRQVRDEIQRLTREIELLGERERLLEEQRNWLRALGEQAARRLANGIAAGTAKPEDASGVFSYTGEESQRLAVAKLDLERLRVDLRRELDARNREFAELGGGRRPDRLAALVRVEVMEAGEVEVAFSYLIAGASWRPRYDARVEVEASRVRLTQQALVTQRTGEDWSRVALALSTARPSAAVSLPDEPDPWYVDVRRPPEPKVTGMPLRTMMSTSRQLAAHEVAPSAALAADSEVDRYSAEAVQAVSEIERSGAAQVFRLSGETDVPADGQPRTLGLADDELSCRFEHVVVPVIAPGAHLRALMSNQTGRVLLPGELHVFHTGAAGDEYVGATALDLTAQDAELKLYLGVDDNITVKHELVERDTDRGILLQSGLRRITCGYRVTLGNRTTTPQRIILMDRLPVPRHERVKLRVLDLKPQPSTRTKLEQLSWELQLAPGEERRIEWRFVVESPAELDLAGLP